MAGPSKESPTDTKGWEKIKRLKVKKGDIKRGVRKIEKITKKHTSQFLVRRWVNVKDVRRSAIGWLMLAGLLIVVLSLQIRWMSSAVTVVSPAEGGTYAEGVIGQIETMNPLFASTVAEQSVARLVFSSLLDYDLDNQLRSNIVDTWSVSEDGTTYTVSLRKDVFWHDGPRLTTDDVEFTVNLMKDRATRALQYETWSSIKTEKASDDTLKFILPSPYAPFAHALTFGILPKHILKDVKPADLRESDFGRKPIGSGPFKFNYLRQVGSADGGLVAHLDANDRYYRGQPLLKRFQIHAYADRDALQRAITSSEVNAALGLGSDQIDTVLAKDSLRAVKNTLSDGMFAIFNNDSPQVKDPKIRHALVQGTDRQAVLKSVFGRGVTMDGPLPLGFLSSKVTGQTKFNLEGASAKLEEDGWKKDGDVRKKDGVELELRMVAPKTEDYRLITDELKKQWSELGVKVEVELVESENIVTDYLRPRNYDVLVYELVVGADADVYPYWHSSQINRLNGLNFANYRSGLADDALSSARARIDPKLREAKYMTFYEQWVSDAPAIALYQPMLSYVTNRNSRSMVSQESVVDVSFRYRNIVNWSVNSTTVMSTP